MKKGMVIYMEVSGTDKPLYLDFTQFPINIENAKITIITNNMPEKFYVSSPNSQKQLHFHSYYELFLINGYGMKMLFENKEILLGDKDIIIVSPHIFHSIRTDNPHKHSSSTLYFSIDRNSLKVQTDFYAGIEQLFSGDFLHVRRQPELSTLINAITAAIAKSETHLISMYLHQLLVKLLLLTDSLPKQGETNDASDTQLSRIHRIHSMINTHFASNDFSLNDIADALFLSPRQVSRIITRHYGCNFKELITRMRLIKAGNLLTHSHLTISAIASAVGYNSIRGFYTAFKNHFGCLPTEYRQNTP